MKSSSSFSLSFCKSVSQRISPSKHGLSSKGQWHITLTLDDLQTHAQECQQQRPAGSLVQHGALCFSAEGQNGGIQLRQRASQIRGLGLNHKFSKQHPALSLPPSPILSLTSMLYTYIFIKQYWFTKNSEKEATIKSRPSCTLHKASLACSWQF